MNPFELPEWLASGQALNETGRSAAVVRGELAPDPAMFGRNLRALALRSPAAVAAIEGAASLSLDELVFVRAEDGAWSATRREGGGAGVESARQLASLRRPLDEAAKLAASVPIEAVGGFVVMGFGLGHHVAALGARLGRAGVIFAFEPDVAMLRAVLERVDHSAWIAATNFALLTSADDPASISSAAEGVEGFLAMGVKFVEHAPSKARLGVDADVFARNLAGVMRALRTTIVTTLVQVDTTLRNSLMNLDRYAAAPGIGELAGIAAGRPAVVVAAGPSLERNLDELAKPGLRDRVVIIAVQTVLKKVLARGIVPHFVTALDHAELSARFYEGLTAQDVEGCTLVVQAMANPAIFQAYPGAVRCPCDELSDRVLGDLQGAKQCESRGKLRPGATVAHMAYYLARHLACDPVILVGQDLGFTDGQYYSAGAAIHRVWSGELSEFNTLEMMEWQRIMRSKSMLHRAKDVLGRPIYTDEQMTTYLAQFERDFATDEREGRSTIDATEGGVVKRHTHPMTLRDALAQCVSAGGRRVEIPAAMVRAGAPLAGRVSARVREVRREAYEVARVSRVTAEKLGAMKNRAGEAAVVNRLIEEVYGLRDRAIAQQTGYYLTQFLNQTGAFNRAKADRAIELDGTLTSLQRQARQIERDIKNVTWLADSADEVGLMLDATVKAIKSGVKQTRPAQPRLAQPRLDESVGASVGVTVGCVAEGASAESGRAGSRPRVLAYVQVEPEYNGLGAGRDLSRLIGAGMNALASMVRRLSECRELDGVIVVGGNAERVRGLLGPVAASMNVTVMSGDEELIRARTRSVGAARAFAGHVWRGGIGGLSVYDEAICPRVASAALKSCPAEALLVVGADWALVDPALCDAVIVRYRESPEMNSLVFSQAPPGLAGCVVSARLVSELGARQDEIGAIASIGGMLSYIPVAPMADPISKPACVTVLPTVRDAGVRFIPDSQGRAATLRSLVERAAGSLSGVGAEQVVSLFAAEHGVRGHGPGVVRLEITTRRARRGMRAAWHGRGDENEAEIELGLERARELIDAARRRWPDAAISFEGRGDLLLHRDWREIVEHAAGAGFSALHVRTDLGAGADVESLVKVVNRSGGAVVSVDLLATTRETYAALAGVDGFEAVVANVQRVLSLRSVRAGLPSPWVVPRMTRCDAVYGELENFYDFWLMTAGAAVIDPLPRAMAGERIVALPVPENVRERVARTEIVIRADGVISGDWDASVEVADGERLVERALLKAG